MNKDLETLRPYLLEITIFGKWKNCNIIFALLENFYVAL